MNEKKIFLSYTWDDREHADLIDKDLKAVGINLVRDIRDFKFGDSLKEQMKQKIGASDFVIVLLSENYFQSINCMFEAQELVEKENAKDKIIPISINANVFKYIEEGKYNDYWESQIGILNEKIQKHPYDNTSKEKKTKCVAIYENIGKFVTLVKDILVPSIDQLKEENYNPILEKVGYTGDELSKYEKLLSILQIEDREEQDIEIDNFIEKNPEYPLGHFAKGNIVLDRKEYKKAVLHYSKAIEFNPNFSYSHNNRSIAKKNLKDNKGAIVDYDRAIEINPSYSDAYINRGVAMSHLKDFKGAIADYDRAIEINPNKSEAYNNRGVVKYNLKEFEGAIADYDRAIELNPNYFSAYNNRGNANSKLGEFKDAIIDYDRCIKLNPNKLDSYFNRGFAKVMVKDLKWGISDFDRAIEINPNNSIAYDYRCNAKILLGDLAGAQEDLDKAKELQ